MLQAQLAFANLPVSRLSPELRQLAVRPSNVIKAHASLSRGSWVSKFMHRYIGTQLTAMLAGAYGMQHMHENKSSVGCNSSNYYFPTASGEFPLYHKNQDS